MRTMRPDIEHHTKKAEILIQTVGPLHMAALKADVAELRRRVGQKYQTTVLMGAVIGGKLGEVVSPSCRPTFGKLKLQPAHEPPALDGIYRRKFVLAPEDLALPDHRMVDSSR